MKLIILDRDGVINHDSDAYIKSPEEWQPIPGSLEAIARLNGVGCRVAIASNQSGIGRGLFDLNTLTGIHEKMHRALAHVGAHIDAVFFCPHRPADHCRCRKPQPGMLLDIARRFSLPLDGVPVVGDSWRDVAAAHAVGARPILVLTGKGRRALAEKTPSITLERHPDLASVVDTLLAERKAKREPIGPVGR